MNKLLVTLFTLGSSTAMAASSRFNLESLVDSVITLIIIGLVFGILYFLVDRAPLIPAWAKEGIKYFILFVAAIAIIGMLLGAAGHPMW